MRHFPLCTRKCRKKKRDTMSLLEKINTDITAAMKSREKEKLEALRAVKAALLLAKTEKGGQEEISPEQEIKILQRLVKQRKEAAEIYKTQNRPELYEKEIAESTVIEAYLPQALTPEQLEAQIRLIIEQTAAASIKDMGKVMSAANAALAGQAEGKNIADMVKKLLAG